MRQKKLNWYGHLRRKAEDNLSRKLMDMVVPGKRRRGRSKHRWLDNIGEDVEIYEMTNDMTEKQTVLENDGEEQTQMCRWSLKVRKVRTIATYC